MQTRRLGKTGYEVSVIGCGTWAIGGDWGQVADSDSMAALHAAADAGVTFFDTADVYGDGRSERLLAALRRERDEELVVATKIGRRAPLDPAYYTLENFRAWVDRSREQLEAATLDLVQLHCPPSDVYDRPEVFAALDELVAESAVAAYGVSVETVDEAYRALRHPGVATVQIIFNAFRQKPAEGFLAVAADAEVGVIARVPLASGLLTGKLRADTAFPEDDHRRFNRYGEAFDVGETFAGVDYEAGLEAVERIRRLVPSDVTMAQFALQWILSHRPVSTTIPGARSPQQARANAAAGLLPPLPDATLRAVRQVYEDLIAPHVAHRW